MRSKHKNRRGSFTVTSDLVMQAVGMPTGVWVVGVYYEPMLNAFRMIVESPMFPEVPEGTMLPNYAPMVSVDEDGTYTWEWGEAI